MNISQVSELGIDLEFCRAACKKSSGSNLSEVPNLAEVSYGNEQTDRCISIPCWQSEKKKV